MGYSTSKTFNYTSLEKKHNDFFAPSFKIYVNGKLLDPAKFPIPGVQVMIPVTVGQECKHIEAGTAEFEIPGQFDLEKHAFKNNVLGTVKVGAALEVKGGYTNPPTLFLGVITSVEYEFDQSGATISVTATDMSTSFNGGVQINTFNKESPQKTVQDILRKATAGSPKKATLGKVDTLPALTVSLVQRGMDDGALLCLLARRFGKTFAVIHGQMVFTNMLTNKTSIGTLTYGKNLFSFKKELCTNNLVSSITVNGTSNTDGSAIQGTCAAPTCGGSGKTAAQADSTVAKKKREENDAIAHSQQDLNKLAEARLNENNINYVNGSATCIGIPELIPGRYIKLEGMDKYCNGSYFITRVTHRFSEQGYTTALQFKGAKSQ